MLCSSMSLTTANRARHSSMLQTFINNSECTDLATAHKVDFTSLWGRLGPRYGQRSADGIVLQLKEPDVYKTSSRRNHAVVKFLFFDNDPSERKKQLNEIQITRKCGENRVGPKVFGSYRFDLLPANRRNFSAKFTSLVGERNLNLFNRSFVAKRFVGCYAMILEDLYNNPVARVTKGWNLYDFAVAASKGEDGITKIPVQKFKNKFLQMKKLGIWHADMHTNNIVVQRIGPVSDQHYEIRVFDFGRSMDLGRNLSGLNENATLRSIGLTKNRGRWMLHAYNYPRLANKNAYSEVIETFRYAQAKGGQALGTSGSLRRAISSQGRRNLNAASAARRAPPPRHPTLPQPRPPRREITPPSPARSNQPMTRKSHLNALLREFNEDPKKAWRKAILKIHPNKGGSTVFFQKASVLYNKFYKNGSSAERRRLAANNAAAERASAARRAAAANAQRRAASNARRAAAANARRRAARNAYLRKVVLVRRHGNAAQPYYGDRIVPPLVPTQSELRVAENMNRAAANAQRRAASNARRAASNARRAAISAKRKAAVRRRAELEQIIRIRRMGPAAQSLFGQPIQIPVFPTASEQAVAASLNRREAKAAQSIERKKEAERIARNREAILKNLHYRKRETIKNAVLKKYNKYTEQNKSAKRGWGSWGKQMIGLRNNLFTERIKQLYELASTRPNAKVVLDDLLNAQYYPHNARLRLPLRKMSKANFENLKTNLKTWHNDFVFYYPNGRQIKF